MEIKDLEHTLWRCKKGEVVEVCAVTERTTLFEITYPDNREPLMQTCETSYIMAAIKKGNLVNIPVEFFRIQRKLDMKYYQGKGRWVRDIKKAAKFAAETIEESLKVFKEKDYEVWKVVV